MQYFGRVYKLEVGTGDTLRTYDGFPAPGRNPAQIQFRIDQSPNATHALAEITLFGLSRESRQSIYREFDVVRLTAGYGDGYGVIFEGNINNVAIGRDGPESMVKLFCQSGADVWGAAYINRSFGPNTPQVDIIRAVAETFGRSVEFVGDLSVLPRAIKGRTLSQDSKSAMDQLARSFGFSWLVSGSKTVVLKDGATWPGAKPFAYSAATGLVGSPEITDKGVDITVLLNPFVRPWDRFQLEAVTGEAAYAGIYTQTRALIPRGEFQVVDLVHEGDFYGGKWATKISGKRG